MDELMLATAHDRRAAPPGITLTIAFVGVWLALLPYPMMILPMLAERIAPADKANLLARVLAIGAVVGLVAQPVFGVLSDHTRARWGRRKPWIFGGMLAGLAAMTVVATAHSGWQLALGWALVALAFNAALSALNAVIPDQVPSSRLGFHSSVVGFTPPVGVLLGVWIVRQLAPDIAAITLAQAGLVCALTLGFVCFARDRRLDAATVRPLDWRALAASFWTDPRRRPDFGVAWLSRALVLFGVTSLQTWLLFYLRDRMGLSTHAATRAMFVCLAVATAAMTLSAIVFGYLSDRLRRRKVFVIVAGCGLAFGLPAILLCTTMEALLGVVAWLGAAQGAYLAVDLALMTEVLPDRGAAAKDMGVFQITNVIPQLILPLCTPWLTAAGGVVRYDMLFVAVGGVTLLGAVAIGFVRSVR